MSQSNVLLAKDAEIIRLILSYKCLLIYGLMIYHFRLPGCLSDVCHEYHTAALAWRILPGLFGGICFVSRWV